MDIEAFILIGGRSTRFGSNKAVSELGGRSLVGWVSEAVTDAFDNVRIMLVAASNDQVIGGMAPLTATPVVFDLVEGRGPLGGVQAALAYAMSEWALILACDYPLVTPELMAFLADLRTPDTDAVVPVQADGNVQPLCAMYRVAACRHAVEALLEPVRPAPALRAIFDRVRTRFVSFEELTKLPGSTEFFANINTPADAERASKLIQARIQAPEIFLERHRA